MALYIHTCIHIYMHTYIHVYIYTIYTYTYTTGTALPSDSCSHYVWIPIGSPIMRWMTIIHMRCIDRATYGEASKPVTYILGDEHPVTSYLSSLCLIATRAILNRHNKGHSLQDLITRGVANDTDHKWRFNIPNMAASTHASFSQAYFESLSYCGGIDYV